MSFVGVHLAIPVLLSNKKFLGRFSIMYFGSDLPSSVILNCNSTVLLISALIVTFPDICGVSFSEGKIKCHLSTLVMQGDVNVIQ